MNSYEEVYEKITKYSFLSLIISATIGFALLLWV